MHNRLDQNANVCLAHDSRLYHIAPSASTTPREGEGSLDVCERPRGPVSAQQWPRKAFGFTPLDGQSYHNAVRALERLSPRCERQQHLRQRCHTLSDATFWLFMRGIEAYLRE